MSTQNKSSFLRTLAISVTGFGCAAGLFLSSSAFVTHSHGVERSGNTSTARLHTTSLRVNETPGGSCVVLTADQSLKSYEAYRRGDWFAVQIPSSKVPHADVIRAREFTEIKIELISDATIVSFRLQPGVTARAELKGGNLEILFVASRARTIATAAIDSPAAHRDQSITRTQNVAPGANVKRAASRAGNTASSKVAVATIANPRKHVSLGSASRNPVPMVESDDSRQADAEVPASAEEESSAASAPEALTAIDPTPTQPETNWSAASIGVTAVSNSVWNNLRENANYWFQAAQLNPVPAGICVGLMVLLIGLVVIERCIATRVSTNAMLSEALPAEATEFETETALAPDVAVANTAEDKRISTTEVYANREVTIGTAIGKLVFDNTHRADIMDSRSPEDRKAIESFLITAITTAESSESDRRRARQALEEYGFVAQHSAALLKGKDAWERSSAARTLGLIGSKTSMPFLIEALNDVDYIVRNEAVASLAALQDPAAIGALVEAARKHPDVPASLLSETLSACSVDNLEVLDLPSSGTALVSESVVPLEDDVEWLDELRDDATDEILSGWLAPLDNADEHPFEGFSQPIVAPRIGTSGYERPYLRVVA